MTHRKTVLYWLYISSIAFGLFACATDDPGFYKHSPSLPPLEVPPDLIKPAEDDAFSIPTIARLIEKKSVLSNDSEVSLHRDGRLRWLVLTGEPTFFWPHIQDFFVKHKIELDWQDEDLGIMETAWIAHYDKAYADFARDKFRVRLEPGTQPGTSELYLSHRGVQEGLHEGEVIPLWLGRPNNRELEIEVLGRLLAFLGLEPQRTKALLAQAKQKQQTAILATESASPAIIFSASMDKAWKQLLLAIDRSGDIVISRERNLGKITVRVDSEHLSGSLVSTLSLQDDKQQVVLFLVKDANKVRVEIRQDNEVVDNSSLARNYLERLYNHL